MIIFNKIKEFDLYIYKIKIRENTENNIKFDYRYNELPLLINNVSIFR